MKVKKKGGKREVWWGWEKRGWKLPKNSKSDNLSGNLDSFIASIYMKSRKKILKGKNTSSLLSMLWQR